MMYNRTMLTPNRYQFLEKLYTSPTGEQFKVLFLVHLVNGELKGRVVSIKPVPNAVQALKGECSVKCLPCLNKSKRIDGSVISIYASVVAPYFSLEFLINSQPTRAPAYK